MRRVLMLGLVLVAAGACNYLSYSVDNDAFATMSVDKKMRLFDAENDVSIAEDEREQMRERLRQIREDMRAVKRQRAALEEDVRNRGEADADRTMDLADTMWDRRLDYLDMSLDYMKGRIGVQGTLISLARAKFELAKVLLIKKNKLEGSESLTVRDFEQQVSEIAQRAKAEQAELDRTKPPLERARLQWLKLRDDVAASSLSALGTPGEDELPVWESW